MRLESLLFGFKYRCLICSGLDIERFLAHANERGADEIHMIRYSELDNIVEIDIVNREATRRARLQVVLDRDGFILDLPRLALH